MSIYIAHHRKKRLWCACVYGYCWFICLCMCLCMCFVVLWASVYLILHYLFLVPWTNIRQSCTVAHLSYYIPLQNLCTVQYRPQDISLINTRMDRWMNGPVWNWKTLQFCYFCYVYFPGDRFLLSVRSCTLLDKPFTRTGFANRAFRCSAPTVWNSLPETIIRCDSLSIFTSKLNLSLDVNNNQICIAP